MESWVSTSFTCLYLVLAWRPWVLVHSATVRWQWRRHNFHSLTDRGHQGLLAPHRHPRAWGGRASGTLDRRAGHTAAQVPLLCARNYSINWISQPNWISSTDCPVPAWAGFTGCRDKLPPSNCNTESCLQEAHRPLEDHEILDPPSRANRSVWDSLGCTEQEE